MQQEISQYISALLYKNNTLCIPNFGTLELRHAPALLDQVQGQLSPPSKEIQFNEDLVMDDGVLLNYLVQQRDCSLAEAQNWLTKQVENIKSALQRREIIELAGIGRFFINFENKLQFIAESANYNTDSFGLQGIQAQAINRSLEEREHLVHQQQAANQPKTPPPAPKQKSWLAKNWWLLLLILIIAIALVFLLPLLQDKIKNSAPIANDIPKERLNTSPSKQLDEDQDDAAVDLNEALDVVEDELTTDESENTDTTDDIADETADDTQEAQSTLSPEEHTAIIAVGLFGNPENVEKLIERLAGMGYSPVSQAEGKLTRIGVSTRYEQESELDDLLKELQARVEKSAFVMYKDGVRVD